MEFEVVKDAYTDAQNWKVDFIRLAGIEQNIDTVRKPFLLNWALIYGISRSYVEVFNSEATL